MDAPLLGGTISQTSFSKLLYLPKHIAYIMVVDSTGAVLQSAGYHQLALKKLCPGLTLSVMDSLNSGLQELLFHMA